MKKKAINFLVYADISKFISIFIFYKYLTQAVRFQNRIKRLPSLKFALNVDFFSLKFIEM